MRARVKSNEVRRLRIAKGLSQQELAKKAGLTQRTIQKAESRDKWMAESTLIDIATSLDVRLDQIAHDVPFGVGQKLFYYIRREELPPYKDSRKELCLLCIHATKLLISDQLLENKLKDGWKVNILIMAEDNPYITAYEDLTKSFNIKREIENVHSKIKIFFKYLFTIALIPYQDELNKALISDNLRNEFEKRGKPLSNDASLTQKGGVWLLIDKEMKYSIRKYEDKQLDIYDFNKISGSLYVRSYMFFPTVLYCMSDKSENDGYVIIEPIFPFFETKDRFTFMIRRSENSAFFDSLKLTESFEEIWKDPSKSKEVFSFGNE